MDEAEKTFEVTGNTYDGFIIDSHAASIVNQGLGLADNNNNPMDPTTTTSNMNANFDQTNTGQGADQGADLSR